MWLDNPLGLAWLGKITEQWILEFTQSETSTVPLLNSKIDVWCSICADRTGHIFFEEHTPPIFQMANR
jgi:hypothetical protein